MLGGLLYANVGDFGNTSLTNGDDINIDQCFRIIWVIVGIPVPKVVINGIGMMS